MTALPKILVIHRRQDDNRREFIEEHYNKANLSFEFVDAIDGQDFSSIHPYQSLIGGDFWGKTKIKPGALGCFLSHRLAWEKLTDSQEEWVIIAEDDSYPDENFKKKWPRYQSQMGQTDLLFINNRISSWAEHEFEPLETVIANDQFNHKIQNSRFRAPGADAYILSSSAAKTLLQKSEELRITCGVDWFLIAMHWKPKSDHIPKIPEFEYIHRHYGDLSKTLNAKISGRPLFRVNRKIPSAIQHAHQVGISDLKSELREYQPPAPI